MILGLPYAIGKMKASNIFTPEGFYDNWYWVIVPLFLITGVFWLYYVLKINYKNVETVKPNLKIEYKEGEPDFQQLDQTKENGPKLLHRISIWNDGERPLKDIKVQISRITPRQAEVKGLPQELHIMNRNSEQDRNNPVFDLYGQEKMFIDVLSLSNKDSDNQIIIQPARSYPDGYLIPAAPYQIEISVFAGGTKCCEKIYSLIEDKNSDVNYKFVDGANVAG